MSYRFGREVDADLEAIWEYIAQNNLEAAHRWNRKFFDAFEALAKAPAMAIFAPILRRNLFDFGQLVLIW